jgi:outer membrane protein assembly factor BamA
MSQVNPTLRASVAQSVLKNNGYFRANVTYENITQKNQKKGKIAYNVHLDSLFTYDSIAYVGFTDSTQRLIDSTLSEALIRKGDPFSVNTLESERNRIGTLLRDNGYYFYNPSYVNYLADTINVPNRVQLRLQLTDGLPEEVMRKWYIGNIDI